MDSELFINEVIAQVRVINRTLNDDELLRFVVEEVVERTALYLRYSDDDKFDARLARVLARVASSIFNKTNRNLENAEPDIEIRSISDNGQSVTFGNTTRNYLATVDDRELFEGFTALLRPYRRIRGIS